MKNKIKNVMIKLKTLFFLLLFSAVTFAQEVTYNKRVVFLWDVTYSMHGGYFGTKGDQQVIIAGQSHVIKQYSEKYDIYDEALNLLVRYINNCENTADTVIELVVVPFGAEVLDTWRASATQEGKAELVQKIRNFCELSPAKVQETNIGGALQYAKEKVITAEAINTLYLMTDGAENVDIPRFYNILNTWCEFSRERNISGYYFALTNQALNNALKDRLSKTCFVVKDPKEVEEEMKDTIEQLVLCEVTMPTSLLVSTIDSEWGLNYTTVNQLNGEAQIRCYIEKNSYIELDTIVSLSNDKKSIKLKPQYETAANNLDDTEEVKLVLRYEVVSDSNFMLMTSSSEINLKGHEIPSGFIYVE